MSDNKEKHVFIEVNIGQAKKHDKHVEVQPINHEGVYSTAGRVGKSHQQYLKILDDYEGQTQLRPITEQQLQKHHTSQSAWVSFRGNVYDATTYLKYHPGGNKLLEGCGRQCDELVQKYHQWVNVQYLLNKYKIGTLVQKYPTNHLHL